MQVPVPRPALVVDLRPWPRPVDEMVLDRLSRPLQRHFGPVLRWRPLQEGGDPQGREAARGSDLGAVVLTGSEAMVGDRSDWMQDLGAALDHWLDRRIPVLGTCFGHQFIADHLGGRIGSFEERRVDLAPLHIIDPHDPILLDLPPLPEMLWTHRDVVLEVPTRLLVTATSDWVPVEAFRHADLPVWGIQAHPEADAALVQAVAQVDALAAPSLRRRPWSAYETPEAKTLLARFARTARDLAPPIPR